jgi:hypothetical protein
MLYIKNDLKLFIVILLLASPALSVVAVAGFPYFPNEKIALMLTLTSGAAWRYGFNAIRLLSAGVATIILILTLLQYLSGGNEMSISSINTALVLISIPFYISYLSRDPKLTLTYIFYIGIFQFACSLIQQVAMFNGYPEIITLFNNYPEQQDYIYPLGEMGFFFRTSGLFTESSSYAVFQWLAIFSAILVDAHKNKFVLLLLALMTFEVLINGSITGYVFALTYIFFSSYKKYFVPLILSCLIVVITLGSVLDLPVDMLGVWLKIVSQFDSLNDETVSVTRLSGGINSLKHSIESGSLLIGVGLSWESPTLDFISLYLRAFGLFGEVALIFYVVKILYLGSLRYAIAACAVLMINGHLSTSINILLLTMGGIFLWCESQYEHRDLKKNAASSVMTVECIS